MQWLWWNKVSLSEIEHVIARCVDARERKIKKEKFKLNEENWYEDVNSDEWGK